MQIKNKKFDISDSLVYLLFGFAVLFLAHVGKNGEPFGLALLFALSATGFSPLLCGVPYIISSLFLGSAPFVALYTVQAALLCVGFYLQRKFSQKAFFKGNFLPLFCLSLGLGGYVAFAPYTPYPVPFSFTFSIGSLPQKVVFVALIFLLSTVFSIAVKALLGKLLKCRLRNNELLYILLFFVLTGLGICRLLSVTAYMGIAFFLLLLFAAVTKDASIVLCAFVLSLPPAIVADLSPARFFFYGASVTLFIKSGRLAATLAVLVVFFTCGYFDGLYAYPTGQLVASILSVCIPSLLFILFPHGILRAMENKLVFYREKHLSRIAINRNRSAIGEKLFELSDVFREIEATFSSLGTEEAEKSAKDYIQNCTVAEVCQNCPQNRGCAHKNVFSEIEKLIQIGCEKGRISLIDLPRGFADACVTPGEVLNAVNRRLGDYKKYMLEAENAASGRALIAGQAQGVSEILKTLALEQSEPLRIYTDKEHDLNRALLGIGIVCSEILIYGEAESPTLSLIVFGNADVKKIAAVTSRLFNAPMTISERITLSRDKFCCILKRRPHFDAAFGVASVRKAGETACGDTHSVIKIDERRFLVALSDGMGSGEYAQRISESTITLLESFYRAKMPSELVLSAINKLLTFNRDESFVCADIAVVNLENGWTDVIKIGSPSGFILSGSAVKVLEGGSLPLGILNDIHPDTASYSLSENDILLFISDGISDAFASPTDLYDVLRASPSGNPQQLADTVLQRALDAYGGIAKDDMTVLAVRLFRPLET